MAHILHSSLEARLSCAGGATLSVGRNDAISTCSRRFARSAGPGARLVSAPAAGFWLGSGTAPPKRARQIAVWGGHPGGRKPDPHPTPAGGPGDRTLLAGWRGQGAAHL